MIFNPNEIQEVTLLMTSGISLVIILIIHIVCEPVGPICSE
jgi:hypothetical protein